MPPQYYNEYQQQSPLPAKGIAPNVYESQQLAYRPEVAVGNQLQTVQQKTVTAKYAKLPNKGIDYINIENRGRLDWIIDRVSGFFLETVYVDIPMMHLLTYYPNLDTSSSKGGSLLVPQLAPAAREQISVPVYTSALSQRPIAPAKPTYQIQYTTKHGPVSPPFTAKVGTGCYCTSRSSVTNKYYESSRFSGNKNVTRSSKLRKAIYHQSNCMKTSPRSRSSKPTFLLQPLKGPVYTTPVTSKKYTSAPLVSVPTYVPADQSYAQGRQLLYTQAYIAPPRPQYVSQLVYQPATVYMHATPVYTDVYARPTTYVQDNSVQGTLKYTQPPEQPPTAAPDADELPNHLLTQQTSQSVTQNYVKVGSSCGLLGSVTS